MESVLHALLLDPYAGSREGLRASLEAEGCLVEAAADASHAVGLMRAGGFDLAVIDLGLVPARGIAQSAWELARLFRVFNPSAPVVLLAAELRRDLEPRPPASAPRWCWRSRSTRPACARSCASSGRSRPGISWRTRSRGPPARGLLRRGRGRR